MVCRMGWASLEKILATLQEGGLPAATPAALVQWGTWTDQQTVTGNIESIVQLGKDAGLTPPVITVIGEVVNLRDDLAWFDKRTLFGKRVLVTRSRSQASRLCTLLEQAGANAIELPTIEIGPLEDFSELDATLADLSGFAWTIFASANSVHSIFERLAIQGKDARALAGPHHRRHRSSDGQRPIPTRNHSRLCSKPARVRSCAKRIIQPRLERRISSTALSGHRARRIGKRTCRDGRIGQPLGRLP